MHQTYDPRLRNAIARSGNPNLFPKLSIPRTTADTWIRDGVKEFVTDPVFEICNSALVAKVLRLEFELAQERAKVALLKSAQIATGFSMQYVRVATAELKTKILSAIDATAKLIPLKETLNLVDMSSARYFSWVKRKVLCRLPDQSSCPKLTPTKITSSEKSVIRELVTSKEYIHFSISSLALYAKRTGAVFASFSAWHRIIREQGLRRPCVRIHPCKPKIGIRASTPNQYWHLDQSVLRLRNGTKIYIRAIIDNFSRYVLAWQVTDDFGGIRTRELIAKALEVSKDLLVGTETAKLIPNIIVDDGCENNNEQVEALIRLGLILKTIAQIDIVQSNSLIESLFLALKHRWLFLQSLEKLEQVIRAVEKYLLDHNNLIPRLALRGATPREMFLGKWTTDDDFKLLQHSEHARQQRKVANLTFSCGACPI